MQDGLICSRWLSFSSIPWHEARLFAVITKQKQTLVYELSSRTDIIRWSDRPTWNYGDALPAGTVGMAPLGLIQAEKSVEEYQCKARQLRMLVAARTGLPLYDLCVQP